MRAKSYTIYQSPPPAHWYQRRIGWFGKTLASVFVIVALSAGVVGYNLNQSRVKTYAAQASQGEQLHKVSATPLATPKLENIVDLQSVLDEWVATHPDQQWGIVARSLEGPAFDASVNSSRGFRAASIYKLFLTLPLFKQIPTEHQTGTQLNVNGGQRSVATCVDLMLRISNNECGEAIGDYLGWSRAENVLKQNGYSNTHFDQDSLTTTADDTAKFLQSLHGDAFTRTARETIMTSLKQQRWRQGIPNGCPGCTVANKTGDIDDVTHDAAIVDYSGGSYVLVVFSQDGTFDQISQLTGKIQQQILDVTQ